MYRYGTYYIWSSLCLELYEKWLFLHCDEKNLPAPPPNRSLFPQNHLCDSLSRILSSSSER
jgi:hypothetical protein